MNLPQRIALRWAKTQHLSSARFVRVFHGTSTKMAHDIMQKGLLSPMGYDSAHWYMVAEDFDTAAHYAKPLEDGKDFGVVLEFHVPTEDKFLSNGSSRHMWDGFPFLWKPAPQRWWALRQPVPASFIVKSTKLDRYYPHP